ncbi:MAG: NAD-dependent epimerase/dehydratase family protein, partial [Gammaproteobacteria bacterium]|nr:NAD-dependent epimerase/dehydratase family protein [Gammaproteobacteria bacterium]
MSEPNALVTGASGFVGRQLVATLLRRGIPVRAAIHNAVSVRHFKGLGGFETTVVDILDRRSLLGALDGITEVYHLAAQVDARARHNELYRINVEGTRNVWECSAEAGVRKALYCSSASVYGLLASSARQITEDVQPRAVEPYGRSKLMGEAVALEIGNLTGPATVVIRPAAVFGPGNLTDFGRSLRKASVSRLISAGTDRSWKFSFVHVEDV